jgi:O-acetyl-ADP-ribose deacetylase (regulator of RNase III)
MINFIRGDATNPLAKGPKVIAHVCNDAGKWGAGFVIALSRKWDKPERSYKHWYSTGKGNVGQDFSLGQIELVSVTSHMWVCNMIAQAGTHHGSKGPPIRYDALDACLRKLGDKCRNQGWAYSSDVTIHMPRIGCGLAGGKWDQVEPLIDKNIPDIPVYVYDLG